MSDVYAMSFNTLNYSGMLFNKGNTRTPLSSAIGGKTKTTNHVEFVVGQEYQTDGGSQPAISEEASLTAPEATIITRSQTTNVTQIFMESVAISYAKQSNMGTLAGVNIANQQANPMNELDFQIAAKMQKIARDIEYTFINGAYQKAANDQTANKTRGLVNAITTNTMAIGGKSLTFWDVCNMVETIDGANAPTNGLTLWVNPTTMLQLNADASRNGLTIVPSDREVNGIRLMEIQTPIGTVYLYRGEFLPTGTALMLNLGVIAPVEQPVPGKGNFFLEPLAKTGAGEKYQVFGQIGLDYGAEWYHGMFTGIAPTFTAPTYSKSVYVSGTVGTIGVDGKLTAANLNKSTVAASDTAKVAVASLEYDIVPGTDPTIAYLWQISANGRTGWTDLTSSYTGYNTSELTVKAADTGKFYRCKVTASGTATGTVYSGNCEVESA